MERQRVIDSCLVILQQLQYGMTEVDDCNALNVKAGRLSQRRSIFARDDAYITEEI